MTKLALWESSVCIKSHGILTHVRDFKFVVFTIEICCTNGKNFNTC